MFAAPDLALHRYIADVHRTPKLSREAELELTRRLKVDDDPKAREKLLGAHLRYVVAIARKYRRYGLPLADLIAEGNFGLVHALGKFEPERGHRFVTYAAYWIRAYILNFIIRSWSLVGVGSGALRSKMFFKLRRERVRITNLVGEGEHADELLAKQMNVSTSKVVSMMRRLETRDLSLETHAFSDSPTTLGDTLPAEDTNQEETVAQGQKQTFLEDAVKEALAALDTRERFIAERRMMAEAEDALSLAEIGRQLGVSRERARQLEARAKRKLKQQIETLSQSWNNRGFDLESAA